jgi:alkaline phosphatase D
MQRRHFLRTGLASVSGWALGCGEDPQPARVVNDAPELFPQSVASGDPRPDSVILWTRVDVEDDVEVTLELFSDAELTSKAQWGPGGPMEIALATADHDHCVKFRVTGLLPDRIYYYRFVVEQDGELRGSQVGRTRTAPEADADRTVRFAFASCQDFGGRYYNSYVHLLARPELDFFVHLGDYIYETAGDEGFQGGAEGRTVDFEDQAGVLTVARGEGESFQAAKSIDNYRQLYRTFRSDPALQRVHEQLPMLAVWDDHEFSDDCWGANATYLDGRVDELDIDRRRAANQAWFEYMPVDYDAAGGDAEFEYDAAVMPPDDLRIYRDFGFGKHVHLVLTDLRSYRSDHLVPEDAYPGTVVLTQAQLEAMGDLPPDATPYVEDIDAFEGGTYAAELRAAATAAEYPAERITGAISAAWINDVLEETGSALAVLDDTMLATLPVGHAYADMMKGSLWGRIGSRYLVARDIFARFAAHRFAETGGASETAMGDTQEAWFLDTMRGSSHTWKVWGNEFCLVPLQIDLSNLGVPDSFRRVFHLNVDDWNGMGNRRDALIAELAAIPNVVAITGDIHAFFAGTPMLRSDPSQKIVEFVTSSISSTTFQSILQNQVETDPVLSNVSGASALAGAIKDLLQLSDGPNPHLGYADVSSHGYAIVEASATQMLTTFYYHAEAEALVDHYADADIDALFKPVRFRVDAGSPELFQEIAGTWRRWDPDTQDWV